MPPGRRAPATTSTAESTMVRSGVLSFSGVGTQMTNVSLPVMSRASSVKEIRPLASTFSSRRSSTSSTGLRPSRSAFDARGVGVEPDDPVSGSSGSTGHGQPGIAEPENAHISRVHALASLESLGHKCPSASRWQPVHIGRSTTGVLHNEARGARWRREEAACGFRTWPTPPGCTTSCPATQRPWGWTARSRARGWSTYGSRTRIARSRRAAGAGRRTTWRCAEARRCSCT